MIGILGWFALQIGAGHLRATNESMGSGGSQSPPMNLVVVVADDLGTDLLAAYEFLYPGTPTLPSPPPTPAIDALVAEGLLFTNFWSNPVCSPTRAQLLTGRHARRNGIGDVLGGSAFDGLSTDQQLLPAFLRHSPHGYVSAAVGKWHLADRHQPITHPLGLPATPWFDQYAGSMFNLNNPGPGYNDWEKTFATPIDAAFDECQATPCQVQLSVLPERPWNYATVDTADDAIHLARTLPEPFLIYVAFNAPHVPLDPPDIPLSGEDCGVVTTLPACGFVPGDKAEKTRCMVQWLDNELGRLICAVDDPFQGPQNPTAIFFLGDNGTAGDQADGSPGAIVPPFDPGHGKGRVFQGGINVPLIVRGPGFPQGEVCHGLVSATDLFATLADLAEVPSTIERPEDSISFEPYLQGLQGPSLRRSVYAEKFRPTFLPDAEGNPPADYLAEKHVQAVRNARYKLIVRNKLDDLGQPVVVEHLFELGDLSAGETGDVYEQDDLIGTWPLGDGSPIDRNYNELRQALLPALPLL